MSTSPDLQQDPISAEVARLAGRDEDRINELRTLLTNHDEAVRAHTLAGAAVAQGNDISGRVHVLEHRSNTLDVKLDKIERGQDDLLREIGKLSERGRFERALRILAYVAVIGMGVSTSVWAGLQLLDRMHVGGG